MPHFCPFCSVLPQFCHRKCENISICSLQIAPMSSFQENLFRLEIIQYSRYRKLSSLLWNVLACDVSRVSLRFLSVLVNYKQSESMHDVWCLFCFFPSIFAGSKPISVSLAIRPRQTHRPFSPIHEGPQPEKTEQECCSNTYNNDIFVNMRLNE